AQSNSTHPVSASVPACSAALPSGARRCLRGPACIEHDQMVGQFIQVDTAWREVFGENLAASVDCSDESLDALPSPEMRRERVHHAVPRFLRHFPVDAFIGNHFCVAFSDGYVDQHAGAAFGCMKVLRQELL